MNKLQSFFTANHTKTTRSYDLRAGANKPELATLAKKFEHEYWDAGRDTGYGGYHNDGRWVQFAKNLINTYEISANSSILDIGCGKGFLVEELKKLMPSLDIHGFDVSKYAIKNAPKEISNLLSVQDVTQYDWPKSDYIIALNVLHNLQLPQLISTLEKIESSKKKDSYICVESYRNEQEKWNLMRWQLTCECFFTPSEWQWIFDKSGYTGDYELIYFE